MCCAGPHVGNVKRVFQGRSINGVFITLECTVFQDSPFAYFRFTSHDGLIEVCVGLVGVFISGIGWWIRSVEPFESVGESFASAVIDL